LAEAIIVALQNYRESTVFIHESRELSGDQSLRLLYQLARGLEQSGAREGSAFAILGGNLPEVFLVQQAVQLLGARYTPLHPMGAVKDLDYILNDAEVEYLIYDPRLHTEKTRELATLNTNLQVFSLGPGEVGIDLLELASQQSG